MNHQLLRKRVRMQDPKKINMAPEPYDKIPTIKQEGPSAAQNVKIRNIINNPKSLHTSDLSMTSVRAKCERVYRYIKHMWQKSTMYFWPHLIVGTHFLSQSHFRLTLSCFIIVQLICYVFFVQQYSIWT